MGHGPTGGVYPSTEPVSRRLAASAGKPDWHIRFPPLRWAASGKGKEASGGRGIYAGTGKTEGGGRGGEAHTIMRMRQCFPQEKWPTVRMAVNGGSAGSLQRSGFRENPTNFLTFVAR